MSEKIKTSEEIRMELADKKVAKTYLEEFEGGIKKELASFLKEISNFNPDFKITHNILLSEELKAQKTALNEVTAKLARLSIPDSIAILKKTETKILFNDKTTQFLTYFCGICFAIAVGGVLYGWNAYQNVAASNQAHFEKGILEGRKQIYNVVPSDKTRNFLDKKYPGWRTKIK